MEKKTALSDVQLFPGTERNGLGQLSALEFESSLTVLNAQRNFKIKLTCCNERAPCDTAVCD